MDILKLWLRGRKTHLVALAAILGAGCRLVSYQTPDGSKVVIGSVLTDPKIGNFKAAIGPTTRSYELTDFESQSRTELLREILAAMPK